jgi:hypothetical protein
MGNLLHLDSERSTYDPLVWLFGFPETRITTSIVNVAK